MIWKWNLKSNLSYNLLVFKTIVLAISWTQQRHYSIINTKVTEMNSIVKTIIGHKMAAAVFVWNEEVSMW